MSNGPPLIIAPGGGAPGIPQPVITGDGETQAIFPDFTPIIPPPLIGVGGGPPPTFPPPTPPPIGQVPVGVLVGPAIAPAPVPPSLAGVVQPQFGTGSATAPPAGGYFPSFTSVFPVPTIVFSNIMMIGDAAPPSTASTQNIIVGGWAQQRPPWLFSEPLRLTRAEPEEPETRAEPEESEPKRPRRGRR